MKNYSLLLRILCSCLFFNGCNSELKKEQYFFEASITESGNYVGVVLKGDSDYKLVRFDSFDDVLVFMGKLSYQHSNERTFEMFEGKTEFFVKYSDSNDIASFVFLENHRVIGSVLGGPYEILKMREALKGDRTK